MTPKIWNGQHGVNVDRSFCTARYESRWSLATIDRVMAGWRGSVKRPVVTDCMENIDWTGRKWARSAHHSPSNPPAPHVSLPSLSNSGLKRLTDLSVTMTQHWFDGPRSDPIFCPIPFRVVLHWKCWLDGRRKCVWGVVDTPLKTQWLPILRAWPPLPPNQHLLTTLAPGLLSASTLLWMMWMMCWWWGLLGFCRESDPFPSMMAKCLCQSRIFFTSVLTRLNANAHCPTYCLDIVTNMFWVHLVKTNPPESSLIGFLFVCLLGFLRIV